MMIDKTAMFPRTKTKTNKLFESHMSVGTRFYVSSMPTRVRTSCLAYQRFGDEGSKVSKHNAACWVYSHPYSK